MPPLAVQDVISCLPAVWFQASCLAAFFAAASATAGAGPSRALKGTQTSYASCLLLPGLSASGYDADHNDNPTWGDKA